MLSFTGHFHDTVRTLFGGWGFLDTPMQIKQLNLLELKATGPIVVLLPT